MQVFKILWAEPAGASNDRVTELSDVRFPGEKVVTKIRWFVVVSEGKDHSCTCLSESFAPVIRVLLTLVLEGRFKPTAAVESPSPAYQSINMPSFTRPGTLRSRFPRSILITERSPCWNPSR